VEVLGIVPIESLSPNDGQQDNENNKLDMGARTLLLVQEMYCLWSANKDNDELLSINHMSMIHEIIHRVDIGLYNNIIKVTEIISNVNFLTDKLLQGNENNENSADVESKEISTLNEFKIDKGLDKNDETGNNILEILLEKAQNVVTLLNKEEAGILYLFPFPIFSQLYGTATGLGPGVGVGLSKAHDGANDDDKDSYLSSIISLLFIMSMTKDVLENQSISLSKCTPGPGSVSGYPSGPSRSISNNSSIATSLILRAVCCGSERSKIAVLSCILDIAHILRPNNILFTTTLDEYGDANCCDLVSSYFCDDRFTMPYWLDGEGDGGMDNGGEETHRPTVVLADEIFHMIITALATPAFVQGLFLFCILPSDNEDQDKKNEQVDRSEEKGDKAKGKKGVNKDMKRENCTRVKNLSIALLEPLLGFIVHDWDMKKIIRSDSVSTTIDNDNEMDLSMSSWSHILPFIKLLEWNQYSNLHNSKPLPTMITSFVQVSIIKF
jgi:hypothetical protein